VLSLIVRRGRLFRHFAVAVSDGSDYRGNCNRFYVVSHYYYSEQFV